MLLSPFSACCRRVLSVLFAGRWELNSEMEFSSAAISNLNILLQRVHFFQHLTFVQIDPLINALEKRSFKSGEVIIREGERGDKFYLISRGSLGVYKRKFLLFKSGLLP